MTCDVTDTIEKIQVHYILKSNRKVILVEARYLKNSLILNYNIRFTKFIIDSYSSLKICYIRLQGDAVLVGGYQDLAIQFPLFSIFQ